MKAAAYGRLNSVAWSVVSTGVYIFLFVGGIVIAKEMQAVRHHVAKLPASATGGLWIVALGGLCLCPSRTDIIPRLSDDALLVLCGFSASLIVLLYAVEGRAFQALLGPIPSYLGRISYSLYLLHVVVLIAVIRLLHGLFPLPLLILLGILLSIVLADVWQRYVEVPTMALGRRLSRRLSDGDRQPPNLSGNLQG